MEREQFKTIVKGLKATYTDPKFIPDAYSFEMWFKMLEDLSYEALSTACYRYIQTGKFPPTIADLREMVAKVATPQITEGEAWQYVLKAVRNSIYGAEEEYTKLPEVVQKAVVSPANLREMAQMKSDELHTVEKAQFLRVFRTVQARQDEDARISPKVRKALENATRAAIEEKKDD